MEKICFVEIFIHIYHKRNVDTDQLCRKICFVTIYAFLRGERLNQNFCLWRKKGQISGMIPGEKRESVIDMGSSIWDSIAISYLLRQCSYKTKLDWLGTGSELWRFWVKIYIVFKIKPSLRGYEARNGKGTESGLHV